ncbi:EthD domain-containing protein [Parahaliea maris]|uniref:EthD domain-containing protein n=1 Tax=Parahaliea maris TaxID=2716870 RepID=A0A5C9A9W8_9GAMM|nr:EthD domain-containing protein [Parahaliea maris]TXS96450.1 EthD domain-containing protein [Parahaliea maris]
MKIDTHPIYLFGIYRWSGTTPEQFKEHYLAHHAPNIGAKIPGVRWYYTFLNKNPSVAQEGPPRPDAFAVMCFESEKALSKAPSTPEWAEAISDNIGFVSNFDTFEVERVTIIAEPH